MGCACGKDKGEKPKTQNHDKAPAQQGNHDNDFDNAGPGVPVGDAGNDGPRLTDAQAELVSLVAMTNFDEDEIRVLRKKYDEIASISTDDGIIYEDEFMKTLLGKKAKDPPIIYQRLFQKFDMGKTGNINFQDFVNGLSCFRTSATDDEKIKFSFSLMDMEENNVLTRDEVESLLKGAFEAAGLQLKPSQIKEVVDNTFDQAFDSEEQKPAIEQITFVQYERMCKKNPVTLNHFTLKELDTWLKHNVELYKLDLAKAAAAENAQGDWFGGKGETHQDSDK